MRRRSHYSLFQLRTLIRHMGSFGFPTDLGNRITKVKKWLAYIDGEYQQNEATDAEFLYDIFVDVLGYRSPFQPDERGWELEFNPRPSLGFFTANSTHVVVEIFLGETRKRVELENDTTEWFIVTDYKEICLYHRSKPTLFYQQFFLESLTNFELLKQFYFILCRRTLLTGTTSSQKPSRISQLLADSQHTEAEIARDFYSHYHKIRLQLVKDFRYRLQQLPQFSNLNSQYSQLGEHEDCVRVEAIAKAQKLLNRILFIAFCEDNHLLPDGMLDDAYKFYNPYLTQPVWENYKAIFSWISQGNSKFSPQIPAYGSSLFATDEILDKILFVGDELCRQIKELTRFDFKEEISSTVLAYILEESVKDLVSLREGGDDSYKRRKFRCPPKSLLNSEAADRTLRTYLADRCSLLAIPDANNRAEVLDYWRSQRQFLLDLKVVVPNCSAGISLAIVFDFLLTEHEQVNQNIAKLNDRLDSQFTDRQEIVTYILQHNLYGCDPSPEAIEIAKLCLWLRAIQLDRPLVSLEENIKLGTLSNYKFAWHSDRDRTPENLVILK